MTLEYFSQRALNLLCMGVLHRERLLKVYRTLKAYEAGAVSAREMEATLDCYEPMG
ncbi:MULTISPECIES: hypothetical protein [unclassified Leptolyngbya]|uniref:hypothetical protein n=1 Tax=unclassified Leptolyngbya TaxID=2650499 RepID=UPI00168533D2|nr:MULTISPECIES: hypothetical protein [unclassified Leptolyngbya]MBD1912712.1 hypothetical protein [Leptolyngbya sp. FACHB-8]MBD2154665.1 hypothetical protein [Leptolyngbya sp. FACHB-16]